MNKKYFISVILPVYNEGDNIKKVIEDSANFLQDRDIFKDYEIIAINDGSRDNTAAILSGLANKFPYLKVITHCRNLGYGKALTSGSTNAQFPLVFFMDADGQFNIGEIEKMLFYLEEFDIIAGNRYKRADAFYRVMLGKIYSWSISLLFRLKLKDVNCGFKLFKRETLETENINCGAGIFYAKLLLKAKNRGFRIKEIPVEHFPRLKGRQTGASPRVIFNAVIDLIKLKSYVRAEKAETLSKIMGRKKYEDEKIYVKR